MEPQDDLENPEPELEQEAEAEAEAAMDYHSKIDSSRPFRSVKEAVAIFGERFLAGEIYAPKQFAFSKQETPCHYTPSPSPLSKKSLTSPKKSFEITSEQPLLIESLKKLEAELEETKMELKILKERESETEVALASLNAELHKNMSKLAQAEAAAASKALASRSNSIVPERARNNQENGFGVAEEEKIRRDLIVRWDTSTTLAQILNAGDENELCGIGRKKKEKKMMKKMKPIIPLLGDLFSRKKENSTTMHNPLFQSSNLNLN